MKEVFVDSWYRFALANPLDEGHKAAVSASEFLVNVPFVTTEEVLDEFLGTMGREGQGLRRKAVQMVRRMLVNPNVRILPQTHESFLEGLTRYEQRLDKEYSLTDCISMNATRREGISEVLTGNRHFEQDGFRRLFIQEGRDWTARGPET